jgi:DNA helicase IV
VTQERDLREEQELLDRAYEGLEAMRADATRMLESVLDLGRGGTFQSRTERDIVVRTSMARLAQLDIGNQALCFGRIDRVPEEPGTAGESFHIGRLAVSGADHEPLVVDWRAPVAEPFYRATGLDPQGLARRRHLAVRGRTVVGVEDEYFAPPGTAPIGGAPLGGDGPMWGDTPPAGNRASDGLPDDGLADDGLELGGAGALLAALGQARSGHMADIVATIQREQDEIIRSPLGGVLMVQGGPGTGKTAVALHRAAYLLYTHRFPLERQGVLVLGPNPLFLRYIERVLPSLGETGVTLSTVAGLVPEVRVRGSDRPAVARLKGEERMATFVARAVRSRERALREDLVAPFGATTLRLSAAESERIVSLARRRPGTHNARRRLVEQQVVQRLVQQYEDVRRRAGSFADEAAPLELAPVEVAAPGTGDAGAAPAIVAPQGADGDETGGAELRGRLRRLPAVAEALDRMWPRLSPHELLHDLYGARPLLAVAGRGVLSADEQASLFRPRSRALDEVPWTVADVALVDEARALLGPRRTRTRPARAEARERVERAREAAGFWPSGLSASPLPAADGSPPGEDEVRSFGHIVVDEAQDLSPMQLRMLARRSISGSMTVVGDIAQATGPWVASDWLEVAAHLTPARPPRLAELTVGYRTPAEVMQVAAGVLAVATPGLTPPRPVRRSGAVPVLATATSESLAARTAEVAATEASAVAGGRTAVLVPAALFGDVVRALEARGLDPVDPRDPDGPGLAGRLVVLPAAESHGLEFDAVVVVEPAAIAAGDERTDEQPPVVSTRGLRSLYVALTRTTRRLAVVHAAPLPAGLHLG